MKVMGVTLDGSRLGFVVINKDSSGAVNIVGTGKVDLKSTREADDLKAFRSTLSEVLAGASPSAIAVKAKPEKGQMSAGAGALKMEAVLMVEAPCPVSFVSAQKVAKIAPAERLLVYLQDAYKAAVSVA